MGLTEALDYRFTPPNPLQRTTRRVAASTVGAKEFSRLTRPLDGLVERATGGRTTASEVLAGLPVVEVTTTGRRSGQPRTAPLVAIPIGDDLALLGTNFGGPSTPAWVLNLEADPTARLAHRRRTADAVARPATDDEYELVFADAATRYVGYERYRERVTHRDIRVFVLTIPPDA